MNVFDFIDKQVSRKVLPYVRLLTIYTNDGVVSNICLTRYNDKKIAKKAAKVGLNEERNMKEITQPIKLANPKGNDIQHGKYYMNYHYENRDLTIFKY